MCGCEVPVPVPVPPCRKLGRLWGQAASFVSPGVVHGRTSVALAAVPGAGRAATACPGAVPVAGTRQWLWLPAGAIVAMHGHCGAACAWESRVQPWQLCAEQRVRAGAVRGYAERQELRGADAGHSCSAESEERVVQRFEVPGVTNYTALLLSPDGSTLYVGAREVLVAINTSHFQLGALARRVRMGLSPVWDLGKGHLGARVPSLAVFRVCASCCTFRSCLGQCGAAAVVIMVLGPSQWLPHHCDWGGEDTDGEDELCQPGEGVHGDQLVRGGLQ